MARREGSVAIAVVLCSERLHFLAYLPPSPASLGICCGLHRALGAGKILFIQGLIDGKFFDKVQHLVRLVAAHGSNSSGAFDSAGRGCSWDCFRLA